jgi:hypothetical protein
MNKACHILVFVIQKILNGKLGETKCKLLTVEGYIDRPPDFPLIRHGLHRKMMCPTIY